MGVGWRQYRYAATRWVRASAAAASCGTFGVSETTRPSRKASSRDVNAAYGAQQGATQRRLNALGVSLTGDEQAAQQRSFGLSKSLADVGAQNMAGTLTRQRQQAILGNPAPTAGIGGS